MQTPKHEFYNKILTVLSQRRIALSKSQQSEFTKEENNFLKGALEELCELGFVRTNHGQITGAYFELSPSGNEMLRTKKMFNKNSFKEIPKWKQFDWYMEEAIKYIIGAVLGFILALATCKQRSLTNTQSNRQSQDTIIAQPNT